MADAVLSVFVSVFGLLVLCVNDAEGYWCYSRYSSYSSNSYYNDNRTYCPYGCCGPAYDQYCCNTDIGIIVGVVIAGIALMCILIVITCCCCCIKKQRGYSGRVVQPGTANNPNVTVIHAGGQPAYGLHPQPYGFQPAAGPYQPPPQVPYKPTDQPHPAYTFFNPAYPPPATGLPDPSQPSTAMSGASAPLSQQGPPPPGFSTGQP